MCYERLEIEDQLVRNETVAWPFGAMLMCLSQCANPALVTSHHQLSAAHSLWQRQLQAASEASSMQAMHPAELWVVSPALSFQSPRKLKPPVHLFRL